MMSPGAKETLGPQGRAWRREWRKACDRRRATGRPGLIEGGRATASTALLALRALPALLAWYVGSQPASQLWCGRPEDDGLPAASCQLQG